MKMYRMQMGEAGAFEMPQELTLTVNVQSPLIAKLAAAAETDAARAQATAKQIYMLCLLSQRTLTAQELQQFLSNSYTVLQDTL